MESALVLAQTLHADKAKFIADYLLSRAQAALESTDALENGHAQYVASMAGTWGWGPVALLAPFVFMHPAALSCFGAISKRAMPW